MSQKTPIAASLGQQSRRRALDHIHNTGKHLPAKVKKVKGSIIQVEFDIDGGYTLPSITIPHFGPEYTRYPTQKGDRGVVIAVDAAIGHVSALGPKKAPGISRPGNLSPLIFLPIASQDWSKVDKDKMTNYGKNGAVLRDKEGKSVFDTDGTRGWGGGFGKPDDYDEENIDPSKYKKHVIANADGVASKSDKKITSTASDNIEHATQKKYKVDATESVDITSPETNVNGDANVSQTLKAALGSFGGLGGNGGGGGGSQIPGNLNMEGQVAGGSLAIAGQQQFAPVHIVPTTGNTITLDKTTPHVFLEPAGGLAALTFAFPSMAAADDGSVITVACTQAVTALTSSGGTFGANQPAAIPAGGAQYRWMYVHAVTKWLLF